MQSRERGAAQVNILFFIITFIVMLGAVFFAYAQSTERTKAEARITEYVQQNDQLRVDLAVRDHYIEDIQKVVGTSGTYNGRDGFTYVADEGSLAEKKPLMDVALPSELRAAVRKFATDHGIPESVATPVPSLLSEATKVLAGKDKRAADLTAENVTLQSQVSAAQRAQSEADSQRQTEVAELDQKYNELRQRIEADNNRQQTQIDNLRDEVKARREELDAVREEHATQIVALNKDIDLQKAQLDAMRLKTELINPPEVADGKVLDASMATRTAWIDIGRDDMLPRGTVFRVVSPDSGAVKAHGRVISLDDDRAEIELYDVVDAFNPVVKGDQVTNSVYSRNVRRNIALVGRFGYPLTKPVVKLMLEKLGNKVFDQVGPGVDLVVVGADNLNEEGDGFTPITDSDDYKNALFLGIEIAPLNKIRDFLQVGDDD